MWHISKNSISEECYEAFNKMKPPIRTIYALMDYDSRELSMITNISQDYIDQLKQQYIKQIQPLPTNALLLTENLKKCNCLLPTSCSEMDRFLGSGIISGEVYLITGRPDCGKSQLCMSIACGICTQNNSVFYIDMGGNFSPTRFYDIMQKRDIKSENQISILKKCTLYRCSTITQLYSLLEHFEDSTFVSQIMSKNLRCIFIDSITPILSQRLSTSIKTAESEISYLMKLLRLIAKRFYIAIIITNGTVMATQNILKPTDMQYLEPYVDTSLMMYLQKDANILKDKIQINKSNYVNTPVSRQYVITSKGVFLKQNT